MIVIDASAMVEALVGRSPAPGLLRALAGALAAPHILDVEVQSALRGLVRGGRLPLPVADEARRDFQDLTIARYEFAPLAERVWKLREQYTVCDAAYIALAEALDAPLLTCAQKLAAGGHHARIVVVGHETE